MYCQRNVKYFCFAKMIIPELHRIVIKFTTYVLLLAFFNLGIWAIQWYFDWSNNVTTIIHYHQIKLQIQPPSHPVHWIPYKLSLKGLSFLPGKRFFSSRLGPLCSENCLLSIFPSARRGHFKQLDETRYLSPTLMSLDIARFTRGEDLFLSGAKCKIFAMHFLGIAPLLSQLLSDMFWTSF